MKKEFLVSYYVDISEDNYQDGIIRDNINYYDGTKIIKALNKVDAIKKVIENNLGYSFNKDNLVDEEETEFKNNFCYTVLVDGENYEVLETDKLYKKWIENKINLYLSDINLIVNELI